MSHPGHITFYPCSRRHEPTITSTAVSHFRASRSHEARSASALGGTIRAVLEKQTTAALGSERVAKKLALQTVPRDPCVQEPKLFPVRINPKGCFL